jgi:hypothetical protein
MEPFNVFSTGDIEKMFPGFVHLNLVNWQKKGYLQKIRREWYCFTAKSYQGNISWLAANLIYQPSCISLETALSYYSMIPEAVYTVTSVTTKKTNRFETPAGIFSYSKLKEQLFGFGHTLVDFSVVSGNDVERTPRKILIAEPEKAILDFFYLNCQYNTEREMEYLRFDRRILETVLDKTKLYEYFERFNSKSLDNRIFKFVKVYSLT